MRTRRAVLLVSGVLLLVAAAAAALYLTNRRPVTTSSKEAYQAWRDGLENERRFYVKDARVAFARALALDPEFAMAMVGLARNSDRDQARSLMERAQRQRSRLNEQERLHLDLENELMKGKREEAFRISEELHQKYPDDIRPAMILARREFERGRPDRGIQIFSEVLSVDPNCADAYNQIGYSYAWRGEYDKGIENIKKYQFMAPDQANPLDSLGEIQAYSGRYDEAIANLNRALAIKPDFFQSFGNLGVAYEGKGDAAKAIESYRKAAQEALSDEQRSGYLLKALHVAVESEDAASARQIAQQLASLPKTKFTDLLRAYADALLDLVEGRPAQAERSLIEVKPKLIALFQVEHPGGSYKPYWGGWNWALARAKRALGKDDEAIELYNEMINPPNPWASFDERRWVYEGRASLAAILAKRGDVDRAEKLLEENRKWNPSWAPTRAAELAVAASRREKVLAAGK